MRNSTLDSDEDRVNGIIIRYATQANARAILECHHSAVHESAAGHYPREILNEWSPPVTAERVTAYIATALPHETTLVAEIDGAVVGFGALVEAQSEVRAVYVSHSAARQGVGSALLREIEGLARARGCAELTFDSSLTAERFYLRHGYAGGARGVHALSSGGRMACVTMTKKLVLP